MTPTPTGSPTSWNTFWAETPCQLQVRHFQPWLHLEMQSNLDFTLREIPRPEDGDCPWKQAMI